MERILVATDFSTRSDRALRRATLVALRTGASLALLHVVDGDRAERLVDHERIDALALLEETAGTLREVDGVAAEPLVRVDDVHDGILKAAEETGAGLVVLGPHRQRLRNVFTGTTVERVVRRSRFPLLVAVQAPSAPYGRTLLALDFDQASRSAARAALAMGIFEHSKLVVMHAFDAPAEGMMRRSLEPAGAVDDYVAGERSVAMEALHDLVGELGLPSAGRRVTAIVGSPARSILESALAEEADLIVLGTHQRKGFERLLIGSVTEDVVRDADRDVLIVPIDQD